MATPNDEGTRQWLIYAPVELIDEVKIAAVRRHVTTSALVREILQDWLEKHPGKQLDENEGRDDAR